MEYRRQKIARPLGYAGRVSRSAEVCAPVCYGDHSRSVQSSPSRVGSVFRPGQRDPASTPHHQTTAQAASTDPERSGTPGAAYPEVAFPARPFVLCGPPSRPLPEDQLVHKRRNGKLFLQIVAHPDFGLPFGQDCLIPIWVATLALRQKSRIVRFDSAAQMLEFFCLPKDGRYHRRMVQGFQRIFGSAILFGTEDQPGGDQLGHRFHFTAERAWRTVVGCRETLSTPRWRFRARTVPVSRRIAAALSGL